MGFFDDIGSGLTAVLNPTAALMGGSVQALGATGLDLGQTLGVKNGFIPANPISEAQMQQGINQGFDAVAAQNALAQQLNNPNLMAQQNELGNALRMQMQGEGANPAQAALAQNTSNNIANQAALMAGQRGAGANAGLMARQAAQQGAGIQQNAVGQAATMQAQQQLAAQQQLQAQQAQQAQQALQAQGQASNAALQNQGNMLGFQKGVNDANAGVAAGNQATNKGLIGGLINGIGSAIGLAHGGEVPDHFSHLKSMYYGGGKVDAMVSPGEGYIKPEDAEKIVAGKKDIDSSMEEIPGKAKVKGDSQKNDTVSKKLDAGGVVISRSVMEKGEKASVEFLKDALRKGDKKEHSDFHAALKRQISSRGK